MLSRLLCALLCLTMAFSAFALTACNTAEEEATEAPTEEATEAATEPITDLELNENGKVNVLVFADDVEKGTKITTKNTEIIEIDPVNVPTNIVGSVDDVKGLYANKNFYKGDYVIKSRLTESDAVIMSFAEEVDK